MKRTCLLAPLALCLVACAQSDMPGAGRYDLGDRILASADAPAKPAVSGQNEATPPVPAKKIIHNAKLELRVEDFAAAEKRIAVLVREANGYIAEFRESRQQGQRTSGAWVTRVPVEKFEGFLGQLDSVGVLENKHIDSKEVTEEFVDLKSRLVSKQQVEKRVAEILEKRAGDVRDVIAIETELGRVREEVERIEGRLRYLSDRTEMTTVTIAVREAQNYTPEPTTLAGRVWAAFHQSLTGLASVGEALLLVVVVCSPWLAVALVLFTPLALVMSLRRRRRRLATV